MSILLDRVLLQSLVHLLLLAYCAQLREISVAKSHWPTTLWKSHHILPSGLSQNSDWNFGKHLILLFTRTFLAVSFHQVPSLNLNVMVLVGGNEIGQMLVPMVWYIYYDYSVEFTCDFCISVLYSSSQNQSSIDNSPIPFTLIRPVPHCLCTISIHRSSTTSPTCTHDVITIAESCSSQDVANQ